MNAPALSIRPMTRADLDTALSWAAAEGWNPGDKDGDCFWAADPGGFLMGWLGDKPAGSIALISYGPAFAYLGLYICVPEERGKGYGLQLWQTAMDMVGGRAIALDGVVAQQANYAASGFSYAHQNIRYGGTAVASVPAEPRVVPVTGAMFEAIAALDRSCFLGPREAFLRCWLKPPHVALAFVDDGKIHGYGVVRACRSGFKIGPLFAGSQEVAEALFFGLSGHCAGAQLFLDVPEPNANARQMAERYGLSPVFETARMYYGRDPHLPLYRIFGLTSFELG